MADDTTSNNSGGSRTSSLGRLFSLGKRDANPVPPLDLDEVSSKKKKAKGLGRRISSGLRKLASSSRSNQSTPHTGKGDEDLDDASSTIKSYHDDASSVYASTRGSSRRSPTARSADAEPQAAHPQQHDSAYSEVAEDEAASVVASEVAGSEAGRLSVEGSVAAVGIEGEPSGMIPVAALPSEASGMLSSEGLDGAAAGVAPVFEEAGAKPGTQDSADELAVAAVAAASELAILEGVVPAASAAAGEGEPAGLVVEPAVPSQAVQLEAAVSLEDCCFDDEEAPVELEELTSARERELLAELEHMTSAQERELLADLERMTSAQERELLAELEELESALPEGAQLPEEPSSRTERQIVGLLQELEQEGQPTAASPGQLAAGQAGEPEAPTVSGGDAPVVVAALDGEPSEEGAAKLGVALMEVAGPGSSSDEVVSPAAAARARQVRAGEVVELEWDSPPARAAERELRQGGAPEGEQQQTEAPVRELLQDDVQEAPGVASDDIVPEEVEPQPQVTPAPMYEARLVVPPPEEDDLFELDIAELSAAEPHDPVAAPVAGAVGGEAAAGGGDVEPTVQVQGAVDEEAAVEEVDELLAQAPAPPPTPAVDLSPAGELASQKAASTIFKRQDEDLQEGSRAEDGNAGQHDAVEAAAEVQLDEAIGWEGSQLTVPVSIEPSRLTVAAGPEGSQLDEAVGWEGSQLTVPVSLEPSRLTAAAGPEGSLLDEAVGWEGSQLTVPVSVEASQLDVAAAVECSQLDVAADATGMQLDVAADATGMQLDVADMPSAAPESEPAGMAAVAASSEEGLLAAASGAAPAVCDDVAVVAAQEEQPQVETSFMTLDLPASISEQQVEVAAQEQPQAEESLAVGVPASVSEQQLGEESSLGLSLLEEGLRPPLVMHTAPLPASHSQEADAEVAGVEAVFLPAVPTAVETTPAPAEAAGPSPAADEAPSEAAPAPVIEQPPAEASSTPAEPAEPADERAAAEGVEEDVEAAVEGVAPPLFLEMELTPAQAEFCSEASPKQAPEGSAAMPVEKESSGAEGVGVEMHTPASNVWQEEEEHAAPAAVAVPMPASRQGDEGEEECAAATAAVETQAGPEAVPAVSAEEGSACAAAAVEAQAPVLAPAQLQVQASAEAATSAMSTEGSVSTPLSDYEPMDVGIPSLLAQLMAESSLMSNEASRAASPEKQACSPVKDGLKGQQLAMGEEAATSAAAPAVTLHVTAGPQLGTPKAAGTRPAQDKAGRGGGAIRLLLGAAVVGVTVLAAAAMGGGMQAKEGKDKAVTGRKKQQEVN